MKLAGIAIALAGCGSASSEPVRPRPADDAAVLKDIAARYASWGRVDDALRVAPELCRAPPTVSPARRSAATEGPHAAKLYYLYASDRAAYLEHRAVAPGFAVVKEAFESDGGRPATSTTTGLFVMARVSSPDSDAGWIYGTVAPDGAVTSAGRVAACMGCHVDAPHDRLFGIRIVEESP